MAYSISVILFGKTAQKNEKFELVLQQELTDGNQIKYILAVKKIPKLHVAEITRGKLWETTNSFQRLVVLAKNILNFKTSKKYEI